MSSKTESRKSIVLYTNDIVLETALQKTAAEGNRLQVLRNRIARAQATKLVRIALVAAQLGDKTIAGEARTKLQALGVLESGQKLADVYEIVESRRASRSKAAQENGVADTQVVESTNAEV
jgi:hypothetical protein